MPAPRCLNTVPEPRTVWGINLYPEKTANRIEFIALINIRPAVGNRSMQISPQCPTRSTLAKQALRSNAVLF